MGSSLFFVYESIIGFHELTTDVGKLMGGQMIQFDSRAMRKVEVGNDIAVVVENSGLSLGTVNLVNLRMLIKTN